MWDEKQFFEDFAKESDNIKPSDEFVDRLKKLDKKPSGKIRVIYRVAAVAASVVLLVAAGIGIFVISRPDNQKPGKEPVTVPIHLGNDETTTTDENLEINQSTLVSLIEDKDVIIVDGDNKSITSSEREELGRMLLNAASTDTISGLIGENREYVIKADKDIVIKIYFDEYILVNGKHMYKVE